MYKFNSVQMSFPRHLKDCGNMYERRGKLLNVATLNVYYDKRVKRAAKIVVRKYRGSYIVVLHATPMNGGCSISVATKKDFVTAINAAFVNMGAKLDTSKLKESYSEADIFREYLSGFARFLGCKANEFDVDEHYEG